MRRFIPHSQSGGGLPSSYLTSCLQVALFLFVVFIPEFVSGQSNWLRQSGGFNQDEALDLSTNYDGEYASTGYFNGTATFGFNAWQSQGYSDVFLQYFDADGATIWSKAYGGAGPDRGTALNFDADGNILLTGYFTTSATFFDQTVTGSSDSLEVFIAKINPNGFVDWVVSCGGIYDDYSYGIDSDPSGNVLVTGKFKGEANFGPFTLTSQNYDGDDEASYDLFAAKLDPDGNWLWVKQGSSHDDDRGMDITADSEGNVLLTGQFSDTLQFDVEYPNDISNAGFVLRMNPDGEEQNFTRFAANYSLAYDIACDSNDDIVLCGNYQGQMAIFSEEIDIIPFGLEYNVFVFKLTPELQLDWYSKYGSESPVSCHALDIGINNEIYLTGVFRCTFEDLSALYGTGIFKSMGYRDVFVLRLDPDGSKTWERWFAGPYDDYCAGIARGVEEDLPMIAGSFQEFFHVPSNSSYLDFDENDISFMSGWANNGIDLYCDDLAYGEIISIETAGQSFGSRDIFFTSPVNLQRGLLDYHWRFDTGTCVLDDLTPCIGELNTYQDDDCPDTLHVCGWDGVEVNSLTGNPGIFGPALNYQWSLGGVDYYENWINTSQWIDCEIQREDLCDAWVDSIYFFSHDDPPAASISDELGFNLDAFPGEIQNILLCEGDPFWLEGGNICPGCDHYWIGGDQVSDSITIAFQTGWHVFNVCTSFNCCTPTAIYIEFDEPIVLPEDSGYAWVDYMNLDVTSDTIYMCPSPGYFAVIVEDIDLIDPDVEENAFWQVFLNGQLISEFTADFELLYTPTVDGYYEFVALPFATWGSACGEDTLYYPQVYADVFVDLLPGPEIDLQWEISDFPLCPGDTGLFVIWGAEDFDLSDINSAEILSNDSLLYNESGWYSISGSSTSEDGCTVTEHDWVEFQMHPAPIIWSDPQNGVVCPGDSVLLTAESGLSYQWIGPLGELLDTTQSIYVTTPGFYYCIHENNDSCVQESNFLETHAYSSPYLVAINGQELCVDEAVVIHLETNAGSSISWAPPLSGNSNQQTVTEPGIYEVTVSSCGIENTLTIEVVESFTPAEITPSAPVICVGDTITLMANQGPYEYEWGPDGLNTSEIEIWEAGIYTLTTIESDGCEGHAEVEILDEEGITPSIMDTTICLGQDALLYAESSSPVFWSEDELGQSVLDTDSIFIAENVIQNVTFYVHTTDDQCGIDPVPVNVLINNASIVQPIYADDSLCFGGYTMLSSSDLEGLEYNWETPSGDVFVDPELEILFGQSTDEGWYYLHVSDMDCSSGSDSVFIEFWVPEIQLLDVVPDLVICEGDEVVFSTELDSPVYIWTTPGDESSTTNELVIEHVGLDDDGIYLLEVQGAECSFQFDPVYLEVVELPVIDLNDTTVFCLEGYLITDLPDGYDQYGWSTGETQPDILVSQEGWLSVEVTNLPECTVRDSLLIEELECITDFYNVFSPGDNGFNEQLDFGVFRIPTERVDIYNRWGNLIRRLDSHPFIWNGLDDSGNLVNEGTYYWILVASVELPHDKQLSGYVMVFTNE